MERSAGGVVYYDAGGDGPVYLLMSNRKGYWEFPKGHVDQGETEEEAAIREVREETGLNDVKIVSGSRLK
jgi:ADP-ribose pyrophosphatase